MKIQRCLLILMLLFSVSVFAASKEGAPTPQFSVKTLDGKTIDSETLLGKVVLLHFWATWCTPCREEMPALEKFYAEHRSEGFEVVAVSADDVGDEAKVRQFAASYSYPIALLASSKTDGFGRVWVLPLSFVIDRKGILRKTDWTGSEKINAASLSKFVLPLINEK